MYIYIYIYTCIYLPIFVGKRPRFPWQILPILHSTPRHIWIAQRLPSVLPDATGPCHPGDPHLASGVYPISDTAIWRIPSLTNPCLVAGDHQCLHIAQSQFPLRCKERQRKISGYINGMCSITCVFMHIYIYTHIMCIYVYYVYT